MSVIQGPSTSFGNQLIYNPEITPEQLRCVNDLRHWIQNEAEFYGRTDEEFLLIYLRGCKFNMEKAKKKMKAYYESRRKLPKWWANRDLSNDNLRSLVQHKTVTIMTDRELHQPSVSIFTFSRFGPNLGNFDQYFKLMSIVMDIMVRRPNCKMNGIISIIDFRKYPFWVVPHFVSPMFVKNFFTSFYQPAPIRIKKIIFLNLPAIGVTLFNKFSQQMLTQKIRQRVILYSSDWTTLYDHVARELLPEEYGGTAGPMEQHDDAFIKETLSYTEYIMDDNKYGFK